MHDMRKGDESIINLSFIDQLHHRFPILLNGYTKFIDAIEPNISHHFVASSRKHMHLPMKIQTDYKLVKLIQNYFRYYKQRRKRIRAQNIQCLLSFPPANRYLT